MLVNSTLINIAPEGWGDADRGGNVHFREYHSRGKDAKLIADYSRPEFVLAGWKPKLEVRAK